LKNSIYPFCGSKPVGRKQAVTSFTVYREGYGSIKESVTLMIDGLT
jgi:hypothetical protein